MKKEVRKIFYTTVTIDRIKFNIYATSRGIIKIDLNSPIDKNFPNKTKVNPDDPLLFGVVKQLKEYFARERKIFDVPLDISGTSFQLSVWNQLMSIPYGNLSSYKMVAYEIGNANAARAVGRANGSNKIPIIIPCHRVINHDGQLGGYACGSDIKQKLLELEGLFTLEIFED
ncbi:MAG: cysteine methyltransferase [Chlorobiaceae bacterium]|mgnify:CR=1 FL=1|nr:cysteine methyltransferase [Chlorobiaceae bacterium]MBA4309422.1 cysteine methyltransferase [Chlorobiaceae bacterium]